MAIQLSDMFNTTSKPVIEWVLRDARALAGGGIDGFIVGITVMFPCHPHRVPPHTVAFMTVLAREVRLHLDMPMGINVLRNDSASALAIATAVAAEFIRVDIHTGARLTTRESFRDVRTGSSGIANCLVAR